MKLNIFEYLEKIKLNSCWYILHDNICDLLKQSYNLTYLDIKLDGDLTSSCCTHIVSKKLKSFQLHYYRDHHTCMDKVQFKMYEHIFQNSYELEYTNIRDIDQLNTIVSTNIKHINVNINSIECIEKLKLFVKNHSGVTVNVLLRTDNIDVMQGLYNFANITELSFDTVNGDEEEKW